ncbi:MAG: putative integral rane protein [Ramlibacter sp.]|nr:putative integral rane protein [Ramlibacter sp.]
MGSGLLFLAAALLTWWGLRSQFGSTGFADVLAALRAQPIARVFAALALTAASFLALALYDLFGVSVVAPGRVAPGTALLAGAAGNAISNTLGFHALTGSAVRARIYLRSGLTGAEAARVVSLSWFALGLGFLTMIAAAEGVQYAAGVTPGSSAAVGAAIAAGLLALLAWLAGGRRELRIFKFRQPMPPARLAMLQMLVGAVESAAAIGALYVLLPADLAPAFSHFAVGCIAAVALGLIAHAPGGIGVFEASITALLSGAGRADLLASLLLYRAIYNILPFLLSVAALALFSLRRRPAINSNADTS